MSPHRWLQILRTVLMPGRGQRRHRRRVPLRAATHRPNLEVLEDRFMPSLNPAGWYPVGPYISGVRAGDFDNDGHIDLATGVSVLLGNGDGTFQPPVPSEIEAYYGQVTAADFNGDGQLDSLWCYNPGEFGVAASVSLGRGDGTFNAPRFFQVGLDTVIGSAVADFNGDGRADLAVGGVDFDGEGVVTVLLNDGDWYVPPPPPPSLQINDLSVAEGNTGTASATFTVTLSAVSTETITVAYATANGTATAGNDYQAASGTLTFAPGQTSKTITVRVDGDRLPEPNETFFVNLSSPTNATIADGQGVGTIVDDEPRVSISDVSKKEGNKNQTTLFTFTVTLSAAYDQAVTLSFRTADGTAKTSDNDYVGKTGTLTFAPGETSKTITIEVKGDTKQEANETFYLDLFGLSSNALFTRNRGLGTILNDD
jgi:hypothetical protein